MTLLARALAGNEPYLHRTRRFHWSWSLLWEPRDLWLGVYWTRQAVGSPSWALGPQRLRVRAALPAAAHQALPEGVVKPLRAQSAGPAKTVRFASAVQQRGFTVASNVVLLDASRVGVVPARDEETR